MYYIAIMWLIALSTILFAEYFHANSSVGKTQMYADLLSDGSAFVGNNGWGLDESEANSTYQKLISLNNKNFRDCIPKKIVYTNTDNNGDISSYNNTLSEEINKNNTANVTVNLKTQTLTAKNPVNRTKKTSTRITYSGGLKVVLEAYKHSYTYNPASQTAYTWGGGHGIASDSLAWEQSADCSGFVSGVFRKCGYYIPSEVCTWDLEGTGKLVNDLDQARPGDIILFWYGDGPSQHVAIYAGKKNNIPYIIHARGNRTDSMARGPSKGVDITPLGYVSYSKMMIRRIVDTSSDAYEISLVQLMSYGLTRDEAIGLEGLRSAGYSNTAIAAAMANWSYESGFSPDAVEGQSSTYNKSYHDRIVTGNVSKIEFVNDGRGVFHFGSYGYGLCQWTTTDWGNPFGDRKARLWDFAQNRGSNVADIYTQVSYAIYEMNTTHTAVSPYSGFNSMTDISQATALFQLKFEGIMNSTVGERCRRAQVYFNIISRMHS